MSMVLGEYPVVGNDVTWVLNEQRMLTGSYVVTGNDADFDLARYDLEDGSGYYELEDGSGFYDIEG
jgi:hypothetical protein